MKTEELVEMILKESLQQTKPDLGIFLKEISQGEIGIMRYLAYEQNHVSASTLSEHLHVTTARIATAMNSLEKKGYIERGRSLEDGRKIVVSITVKGEDKINEIRNEIVKKLTFMIDEIGIEEIAHYLEVRVRMIQLLNK